MRLKKDDEGFLRFLKDEKFIEWKLSPTDELDRYWEDFSHQFPEKRENIELAGKHFLNINISSHKVSEEKRHEALNRLKQSLNAYNRKRNIRRFAYAATACILVFFFSILYVQKKDTNRKEGIFSNATDYIIGNALESEDILFITGNNTTSFQKNVDIEISDDKIAQVRKEQEVTEEIPIEQNTMNRIIVPYGKRSKIILSDGTQAWLNSGSSLEFPSTFSGKKREVFLSGEMYIEVAADKNKPFYVHTDGYNVKVYGTKFNISSYPDAPSSVVLAEGSVALQSAGNQELLLSPNEQATYADDGTFQTKKVDVQSFISWKDGYLMFEDTPVIEALKQIEKYYNLLFNFDDDVSFQGLTCTGKIILSDNLDNVMTALSLISATKYKREEKIIYIYKEK